MYLYLNIFIFQILFQIHMIWLLINCNIKLFLTEISLDLFH